MVKRKFIILGFGLLGFVSCSFMPSLTLSGPANEEEKQYQISVENLTPELGSISLEDGIAKGFEGDDITIIAAPISQSTALASPLSSLTDLQINGSEIAINANGKYRFSMPKENIEIKGSFAIKSSDQGVEGIALTIADPNTGSASLSISNREPYSPNAKYSESDYCLVDPLPREDYSLQKISNNSKIVLKDGTNSYTFLLEKENKLDLSFGLTVDKDFVSFKNAYEKDYSSFDYVKEIDEKRITLPQFSYAVFKLVEETRNLKVVSHNEAVSQAFLFTNTQETNTTWMRNENGYYKENITCSSNIKMAERAYLDANSNNVSYYRVKGDDVKSQSEADYSEATKQSMSFSRYFALYSVNLYAPLAYLVSKDTLLDSSLLTKSKDGYSLELFLAPEAASNYRKYMLTTTSDADFALARQKQLSIFHSIILNVSLRNDLKMKTAQIEEKYDVMSQIGAVPTTGTEDVVFSYDAAKIPAPDSTSGD